MTYQSVKLNKHLLNWISTYITLQKYISNIDDMLDNDKDFQRVFNRYKMRISAYKTLFNLSVYAFLYSVSILIKG